MEISRWSSEARANTTGSHRKTIAPRMGCRKPREKSRRPPPGRMAVVPLIRWCSLARLARPPANFLDASGVATRLRFIGAFAWKAKAASSDRSSQFSVATAH